MSNFLKQGCPRNRIMTLSTGFLVTIILAGCSACFGTKCYITSCSCNGGMKWSLTKPETDGCSEIALGGHTSQCPSEDTVQLFDIPFETEDLHDQNIYSTSSVNKLSQTTSTERLIKTTIPSCETTKETWINEDCSKRCTCYENQWVCNSTHECTENATCTVLEGVGRCVCKTGYTGDGDTCKPFYRDCHDVYKDGHTQNGVYTILPTGWPDTPFNVSCDMETPGGGWTIFQRRVDGQTNFYRNWTSYKSGFGSLDEGKDFWLGNEKLFYLTNQRAYKLRVDIVNNNDESKHQEYGTFRIGNESSNYQLMEHGTYKGDAGHGLKYAEGGYFSTYDNDNDKCQLFNCASEHHGAWWYTNDWCRSCWHITSRRYCDDFVTNSTCLNLCTYANLNSDYNGGNGRKMNWFIAHNCPVRSSYMKITPNL